MPTKKKQDPSPPAAEIKYLGWRIYRDTGLPYRSWQFREVHAPSGAEKGDELHDAGPAGAHYMKRFRFRRTGGEWPVFRRCTTQEEVEELLGLCLAPWPRTPREAEIRTIAALAGIVTEIEALTRATNAAAHDSRVLADVRKAMDAPTPAAAQQNAHLRLLCQDAYRHGERFRDWELLHDVPGISAHKGDILREEDGERELTPFKLLQANRRQIGAPEWWQVRHLFVGIASWHEDVDDDDDEVEAEVDVPPAVDPQIENDVAVRKLRRALPHSGPGGDPSRCPSYVALEITADIPAAGLHVGDVMIYDTYPLLKRYDVRCRIEPIPRRHFRAILNARALRVIDCTGRTWRDLDYVVRRLTMVIKRKKSMNASDRSSPLKVLRVPMECVDEPICALSDDGAIFQLLADCGGRMPVL